MNARQLASIAQARGFDWNAGNRIKSVAKHQVSCQEAEEVFGNRPLLLLEDVAHSQNEERFRAFGQSDMGRRLALSFTMRGRLIRVISARPMSRKERAWYEKQN